MRAANRFSCSVLSDFQPNLDQHDAAIDDIFLDLRTELQEALVLMLAANPMTYSTPARLYQLRSKITISPAAGNCCDVALHEHLGLFAVGGRRQRHHAKDTRADAFGEGLDRAALAGRIPSLEHDDDPRTRGLHPVLQLAKLDLQLVQLFLVDLALHLAGMPGCGRRLRRFHGANL